MLRPRRARVVCLDRVVSDEREDPRRRAMLRHEGRGPRRIVAAIHERWHGAANHARTPRSSSTRPPTSPRGPTGSRTGASCRCTCTSAGRATATTSTWARPSSTSASARRAADDVAADARRLPGGVRGARAEVRADLLAAALLDALGHVRQRAGGGSEPSATRAGHRHADRLGRDRDARARACSGGSSAARPTRRSTRSSSATARRTGCSSPSTRSSTSPAAAGSGAAPRFAGTLLNVKPILDDRGRRGGAAEARAREREGARGARIAARAAIGGRAHAADRPRPRGRARAAGGAGARSCAEARPEAVIEVATSLGAVVGTHAGPGTVGLFWFDDG